MTCMSALHGLHKQTVDKNEAVCLGSAFAPKGNPALGLYLARDNDERPVIDGSFVACMPVNKHEPSQDVCLLMRSMCVIAITYAA